MRKTYEIKTDQTVFNIEYGSDLALGFFINVYDARAKKSSDPGGIDAPYSWDSKFQFWHKEIPQDVYDVIMTFVGSLPISN